MNIAFGTLFTVVFEHGYFTGSRLECMAVSPDQQSASAIQRNGLLFKPLKNGFTVLYESVMAGKPRTREAALEQALELRFVITLNDPYFFNYTALNATDLTGSLCYFNNISHPAGALHAGEFASEQEVVTVKSVNGESFVKPFGLIDIRLSAGLPEQYTIRFRERSTYWRYLVISQHLKELNSPAVLGNNHPFKGPEPMVLPDRRSALAFVSVNPISIKESGNDTFQLVENYDPAAGKYKVVLKTLPLPDVRAISRLQPRDAAGEYSYSEIFI